MKVSKLVLFQFLILSLVSMIKLSYCIQSNSLLLCPEIEKLSLLSFKQSLKDPHHLLSSWDVEVDCCKWKRVVCSNSTGHVQQLHLQGLSEFHGWVNVVSGLSGKISSSLLNLKHLTYLNLSYNHFDGQTIPSFIGSFTEMQQLDLSFSGFQGNIPHDIGNLSNLYSLRLEDDLSSGGTFLDVDSLEWLPRLSRLEHLNMNYANLSRATNWAKVINSLPSLLELHLSGCSLNFSHPPNHVNLTSLKFLVLSFNYVISDSLGYIPQWVFQLRNLLFLDLRHNYFVGPAPTASNATKIQYIDLSFNFCFDTIPDWLYFCKDLESLRMNSNPFLQGEISDSIGNLTSLQSLDLSNNELSGKLPREITNLCRIQSLDLSSNQLHGEVQDSFGNMSDCFVGSLEVLKLSGNQLSGHLLDRFMEFKILRTLDLGSNSLSGEIPTTLGHLSSLEELFLNNNNFTGNLPESMGQLFDLEVFLVENNKLEGIVTESHFTNLSKLTTFSASGNHLTLSVGQNWTPPIQLLELGLGSWSMGVVGSEIPTWLQTKRNFLFLDLSNIGMSGSIPSWFFYICFLNVSHNNLHGKIPNIINTYSCGIQRMYLSSNKLSGSLPHIGGSSIMLELDLSQNSFTGGLTNLLCDMIQDNYGLQVLLLEGNCLSGEIPDCWEKWPLLTVLKLGNNTMSGSIPISIGLLTNLESLSLSGNRFSGQIPFTMQNCTGLWKIDLSHNNLDGNLPTWMGTSLVNLKFLILHSNKLNGVISSEICHLQSLQILSLSNNQISGRIPRCVSNLTAMATERSLALEYTNGPGIYYGAPSVFSGPIFESASIVTKGLELEYSTILSLVTSIDLSSNNMSGEIPKELTSLVELRSLNLSGNHFTGWIPDSIGDMKQLESLDLSKNSLSGHIPNGFKLLSSLNHLNLSFNKLTGRIPESTQLQSFNASSFMGNDLSGPPLTSDEVHPKKEEKEGDHESEIEWFLVLLSLGYAVGFSSVCTALVVIKSWRDAYFGLLQGIWDKVYVFVCIRWIRLTKPSASTS